MNAIKLCLALLVTLPSFSQPPQPTRPDTTPHTVSFITVEPGVQLEVLDWGGTGRPIIFLAGMGNDAHNWDGFAPQFTAHYHVYGITRRGFGASSKPAPTATNYTATRLGDDILAVIQSLHLTRPVLIGHSFAGQEMSSIGSRHPEAVGGLVYLDAAYGGSFYDPAHPVLEIEMNRLRDQINRIEAGGADEKASLLQLETSVAQFEKTLHTANLDIASMPPIPPRPPIQAALNFGVQGFTSVSVPVLAIFACPHNWDRIFANDPAMKAQRLAVDRANCTAQADFIASHVPTAHVVRIPDADHYVFLSNRDQVTDEINKFVATLH